MMEIEIERRGRGEEGEGGQERNGGIERGVEEEGKEGWRRKGYK